MEEEKITPTPRNDELSSINQNESDNKNNNDGERGRKRIKKANDNNRIRRGPSSTRSKSKVGQSTTGIPIDGANNNIVQQSTPKSRSYPPPPRSPIAGSPYHQPVQSRPSSIGPYGVDISGKLLPYMNTPSKSVQRTSTQSRINVGKLNPNSRSSFVTPGFVSLVDKAVKEHKVFCIGGVYHAIRKALKSRGWIEKQINTFNPQYMRSIIGSHLNRESADTRTVAEDETENSYTQRVLANYPPDFVWVIRRDNIPWAQMHRDQTLNRYPRAYFTTKVGIAACLQNIHWYSEPGVSDTFFPRCYRLSLEEEKQAFLDDYRLTACVSLLRWFVMNYDRQAERGVYDTNSKISCLSLDFAVRQINNYVRMRRHEDIDWLMPPAFLSQHWEIFLNQYYSVLHNKSKLNPNDSSETAKMKYDTAKKAIQRLTPYWGQMVADGIMNIWICKPGARSRGKGIVLMNSLDKILGLLNQSSAREANWVVQKYLEKPMLIYKTKFDMRQWFIVTDWSPLTVWFAKESYLRFCTKPFSLDDFHESVHLCNNAVQCKYQNALNRDPALPDENMWDCYTFQAYLKTIGKLDMWDKVIYPGMKQGIIGVLLASQETIDVKKNCFELYGADYMFTEDFKPWLIEINSCPCMSGSTSVTARMCAQCLEDTIKVVIDHKHDKNADTGMFELIYRQNPASFSISNFYSNDLLLVGKKMTKEVDWPGIMTKYNARRDSVHSVKSNAPPQVKESKTNQGSKVKLPRASFQQIKGKDYNNSSFNELVQKLHLKESNGGIGNETVQKAQSSGSSLTPTPLTPLTPISPTSSYKYSPNRGETSKGKLDTKSILNVKRIENPNNSNIGPDSNKLQEIQNITNTDPVELKENNNNENINEKTGSIPLSYLMYNAKTNPITITDMIREYTDSANKVRKMEALAKKVKDERKGLQRKGSGIKKGRPKSKSPYEQQSKQLTNITPTPPTSSKSNTDKRNKSPLRLKLDEFQSLKEAVKASRAMILDSSFIENFPKSSFKPTSHSQGNIKKS